MISIVLLHGKTLAMIDHGNRKLYYLPLTYYQGDDHFALVEYEISSYLYENTTAYHKVELIEYEE
jgi:hypothetical protein